jgi:hypothetical protein
MTFKVRLVLLFPIALVLALGCGKGGTTPASVYGKVTYNGQPLKGGTIAFHDKNGGLYNGTIGLDGSYKISDLPAAAMTITVETDTAKVDSTAQPTYGANSRAGGAKKDKGQIQSKAPEGVELTKGEYVPIPKKYAVETRSGLTATLHAGSQEQNIDLTGDLKEK